MTPNTTTDEENISLLTTTLIGIIGDACLMPILFGGNRKIAHFQIPSYVMSRIHETIQEFLDEEGFFMSVGYFYVGNTDGDMFLDVLIYEEEENFEAFMQAFSDLHEGKLSLREYHFLIGDLFGYSEESTERYLKEYNVFPNQKHIDFWKEHDIPKERCILFKPLEDYVIALHEDIEEEEEVTLKQSNPKKENIFERIFGGRSREKETV